MKTMTFRLHYGIHTPIAWLIFRWLSLCFPSVLQRTLTHMQIDSNETLFVHRIYNANDWQLCASTVQTHKRKLAKFKKIIKFVYGLHISQLRLKTTENHTHWIDQVQVKNQDSCLMWFLFVLFFCELWICCCCLEIFFFVSFWFLIDVTALRLTRTFKRIKASKIYEK